MDKKDIPNAKVITRWLLSLNHSSHFIERVMERNGGEQALLGLKKLQDDINRQHKITPLMFDNERGLIIPKTYKG